MRILWCLFHVIGIVLAIFLMCVDEPGFDPVWLWLFGSIVANVIMIILALSGGRK